MREVSRRSPHTLFFARASGAAAVATAAVA